ncbi:MAG: YitT family protein [Ruminococcaceae bacterium]|nr:YitT family protein [Oscillospiraceae bacterium]
MKNRVFEIFLSISGGAVFALAVAWIASPAGLVTGGVSGVGIVLKEVTNGALPIFVTSFVLNVPLFIICTLQRGLSFISKSVIAFASVTVFLSLFENIPSPLGLENDILLSSLSYGLISGAGLGLVLRAGATSGGTDMLAAIIKHKSPETSISFLIVLIDIAVIALGVFVFGLRISLYAIAALFISARVIDTVLSGLGVSKAVFIVSDESEEISRHIGTELKRGVSCIDIVGMYTGEKRKMLFAVVSSRELAELRRIVGDCDKKAFVTVSDAKQVLGEGFGDLIGSKESLS